MKKENKLCLKCYYRQLHEDEEGGFCTIIFDDCCDISKRECEDYVSDNPAERRIDRMDACCVRILRELLVDGVLVNDTIERLKEFASEKETKFDPDPFWADAHLWLRDLLELRDVLVKLEK